VIVTVMAIKAVTPMVNSNIGHLKKIDPTTGTNK
jgi:hypothetical protein